ncbi:MAG TPA: DUF2017 domain-containing protein [Galbitalea sp.]
MSGFRARGDGASARFSADEARLLATLATQLASLVAERGEPGDDPVLDRLLPDAYRDNDEHAAEFRRFTEEDISDEKVRNALTLATALQDHQGTKAIKIELDAAEALAWLRALNDIRLALAVRLDVNDSGEPTVLGEQAEMNHAIYYWLGALQESLVLAVDR